MNWNNTENTDASKKISWTSVLYAVLQALIAALTALGVSSCAQLINN